jgi:predicted DNA repair protein MutK
MAGTTLFTLLDDLATLLDDVAVLTKVATKKTAGVLGDDLALNAEQVAGVIPERELPVVWAVAKGSLVNKSILVPLALLISAVASWAITPLLMLGGSFLCYEGCEKLAHRYLAHDEDARREAALVQAIADPAVDIVAFERAKIRGAVRTDFILSAEVIVISLGAIASAPFGTRVLALVAVALVMTVAVYGIVAGIVKLDDVGLRLSKQTGAARRLGQLILRGAPYLMKGLSIAGTVAMFLVGGGILVHGIPGAEALGERLAAAVPAAAFIIPSLWSGLVGLLAGALLLAVVTGVQRLRGGAPEAGRPA